MTISYFLSRHPGHDLASPMIPISFHIRELLNNVAKLYSTIEALIDLES